MCIFTQISAAIPSLGSELMLLSTGGSDVSAVAMLALILCLIVCRWMSLCRGYLIRQQDVMLGWNKSQSLPSNWGLMFCAGISPPGSLYLLGAAWRGPVSKVEAAGSSSSAECASWPGVTGPPAGSGTGGPLFYYLCSFTCTEKGNVLPQGAFPSPAITPPGSARCICLPCQIEIMRSPDLT